MLIKISGYLDHQRASIPDLANDISVDARLTAMLLTLVNSTAFALRSKMTKVQEAVNYLGIRRTVSLVISAYLIRAQSMLASKLPESLRLWHQRRSVLIASTAAAFARHADGLSTDTAYVMGLLQDFGILVMAQGIGDQYIQLIDRVKQIGQLRLDILEQKSFGVTHAEVSAALLQKWGLPPSFIPCVLFHHSLDELQISTAERRFLHVMRVGEALANAMDNCSAHRNQALNLLLSDAGEMTVNDIKACLGEAVAKTAESSKLFSIPAPDPATLKAILDKIANEVHEFEDFADGIGMDADGIGITELETSSQTPAVPASTPFAIIFEHNAAEIQTISGYLTSGGIRPVVCPSAAEARQHSQGAQAVLCDLAFGVAAPALIKQLRADGYRGNIIAMSEDRSRATIERAIQSGITGFLPKPFTQSMLIEKLTANVAK